MHLLDESADHGVHDSVLLVVPLAVAVQLVANEFGPVLLVTIRFGLEEALALKLLLICMLLVVTKAL